jgi:hypothetical protein
MADQLLAKMHMCGFDLCSLWLVIIYVYIYFAAGGRK